MTTLHQFRTLTKDHWQAFAAWLRTELGEHSADRRASSQEPFHPFHYSVYPHFM